MVNYHCARCGYQVKHKHNFLKHLRRKNPCKPINNDIPIEEVRKQFNDSQQKQEIPISETKVNQQETELEHSCQYCFRKLSSYKNKWRHEKLCKKKTDLNKDSQEKLIDLFKEQIAVMKEEHAKEKQALRNEISSLLEKVGSVTNIAHQHNIFINNYGSENIDYINHDFLNKLIKSPFGAVPKLIKYVHFNPKHPENHNVKITNKKLPYASVWEGNKWTFRDKKEVIENMVDKSFNLIDEHYEDTHVNDTSNKYENFKKKYQEGEKDVLKNITKDTELLMLNSSKSE